VRFISANSLFSSAVWAPTGWWIFRSGISAFVGEVRTAPKYRFYFVGDKFPALWPVADGGVSVLGELYDLPFDVGGAVPRRFRAPDP
jgi:hypothetical protein